MTELTSPSAQLTEAQRALLARRLRRRRAPAAPVVPPLPEGQEPPLSYAQERLWFMEQYAPGNVAYTIPFVRRLRGPLDAAALSRAFDEAAARHQPLRARFPASDDGRPLVVIAPEASVPFTTAAAASAEEARERVDAFLAEPFDLAAGPLIRALLVRLADGDHVLAVAVHHIAADGWSADVLLREVLGRCAGRPAPELPVTYGDFAAWQRDRPDAEADVAYWRERLAGLQPLELPADLPRPPELTYRGAAHSFTVDRELAARLAGIGRDRGCTPYMVLLAAFAALLGRYAGQEDVVLGSPVAGRSLPELENLVGCFVNMLPMRVDLSGGPSFTDLLDRVRESATGAYAHQELPFERLVAELNVPREVSRSPVFQVLFAMQNYASAEPTAGDGPVVEGFDLGVWATRFDLELYTWGEGSFLFVYNTALFAPERIERMAGHLATLLEGVAADPAAPVHRVELLTAAERAERERWNDTLTPLGEPDLLHRPFEERASSSDVALVHPGGGITYEELDRRASALAGELVAAGVRRGELVAVVMERGWEQVVAVLAVGKAGAAYLPVDADLPDRRRFELLERGECAVALTQPRLESSLEWPPGVTRLAVHPAPSTVSAVECPARPDDLAYVIFTSGSTGAPKGVMIEHRAALNTVRDINHRFRVGPSDRIIALSALSFDLSVYDVYGALAAGATLVMGEPSGDKDPAAWARLVEEHRVTVWNSVPALMELLVDHAEHEGSDLSSLRLVMMSGDWIPTTLPGRIRALAPDAEIVSLGGATEGSIWSIAYPVGEVDPSWTSIPYGTPLANQSFHILDRGRCDVPVGVPGELHIGGVGVAAGYWRDPERTAASFVTHPRTGERLYRTGDLGRYRPDGTIEFLGRADAQVKIRGYRIELGEIEAHLSRHPAVAECVVATSGTGTGAQLVAYVVPRTSDAEAAALRAHLAETLPAYMIPARFIPLPSLPLTANGKVDRARLPAPSASTSWAQTRTEPSTEAERLVAAVWADVLELDGFGVDDDFFDVGGHSLLAIKVVARLRRELPPGATPIAVVDLFKHPTVRGLAALVEGTATASRGLLHELTPRRTSPPVLTYVCVPYGGGAAVVYQPLADALPGEYALWSVAIPGHDVGLDEERLPLEEVAARCVAEIMEKVRGPVALYGHCGVGSALTVEIARRLEAEGRPLEAVYIGAIFPFARPSKGPAALLAKLARREFLRGDRGYVNWLTSMGLDMGDLDPAQARHIVRTMRRDSEAAEEYFTGLFEGAVTRLRAPVISVAGEHDPATEFHEERFREWHFLSPVAGVVELDEAGHFFLKYRAGELAAIVTRTHRALAEGGEAGGETWRLAATSRDDSSGTGAPRREPTTPAPSMGRFATVACGQLVSMLGAALTEFAIPVWIYLTTGSLAQFALLAVVGLVPGMLVAPLAGAVVDRGNRRTVMLYGDAAALTTQLGLGLLLWTDRLETWHIYPLLGVLSVALTFQRLAYGSAVPQLVPKRYLGHANGMVQMAGGMTQLLVPLAATGLMAAIGLEGILALDVASYAFAIGVTLLVRFPAAMAWRRKEPVLAEMVAGFRYSWGDPGFRRMLLFFAVLNVFLSPLFLLVSPLVLSFGTLADVGRISFVSGLGVFLGGLTMTAWGGPRRGRMRTVLWFTLALAAFCLVTGLRADLVTIGVGAFGMSLWLTLLNGVYATIVQVKVPQRFHGRVFALNTLIAWSTLPLGFGLVAPYGAAVFDPLMAPDGPLAGTLGAVIGTGAGRGVGLMYLLFAVAMAVLAVVTLRSRLPKLVDETPDALPDDLIGLEALGRP
ncbi:non-ribosomal peptide synthetase/MFS transporter [Nonomuraea rhodomycinica]|uniref:Amino acid adenylation domain-containing protein n=1 Tax=Nonomuraea rhodomycinica TaxID=1712872 RepID=A0A7Y6MB62_9ACTN|nr:non-ribosomal peptide synthetase/MFS transporter [Nonomuraea rhodomycinica]NUW41372.1 amino acid adenylation domain-containing protein [Nonomuraea rhodomycinica]